MHWQDLARSQAGVVAREQLRAHGLSEDAIRGLIARHELVTLLPGVYTPRPVPASWLQRCWAAVLWSEGVLSHRSVAPLWQVPAPASTLVHVTVGDRRYRKILPNVRLHRVRLGAMDRTTLEGLPVTTSERTVIDLMRTERLGTARELRDRGLQQGWLTEASIPRSVEAQPGRTGNRRLRRLYDELERGVQSEAERRLHALLRRAGLVGWRVQYRLRFAGRVAYADVAFPAAKIAIEVDGRRFHDDGSDRFEDDRARQNAFVLAGWRVIRVTWRMLTEAPDELIAQIAQLLAA